MKATFLSIVFLVLAVVVSATTHNQTTSSKHHNNSTAIAIAKAKSQNYIIQIRRESKLEEFVHKVEDFFENLLEEIADSLGDLISRDEDGMDKKFQVHDSYDIGGIFKAVGVKVADDRYLDRMSSLPDVTSIIPDDEIQFDLPYAEKRKIDKRYYIRHVVLPNSSYQNNYAENKTMSPVSAAAEQTHSSYSANTSGWSSTILPTSTDSSHKSKPTKVMASDNDDDDDIKYVEQSGSDTPWNLVRISERSKNYSLPYIYDQNAGKGVTVYVVDDGINIKHKDFEGRAKYGWSTFKSKLADRGNATASSYGSSSQEKSENTEDGGGHGTHVAGIIAGKHYGVAKKANLVSVQVLGSNGKGTISSLLGGVQWIMQQAQNSTSPIVVNMSLGVPKTTSGAKALNEAVEAAVEAGIPVIAAAGNSKCNACDIVPAGSKQVYTVGSITKEDEMDPNSCYGRCLNILAPGYDVTSTYVGSDTAFATLSGTSQASPHVAGVAALLLPHMGDKVKPKDLYKMLDDLATPDMISDVPGAMTPNALVFNGQKKSADNTTKSN
ncbi:cuticle-degrading protease precursor [Lichtheimia corymbifera JMRC:FSU:9682]|uniref:Cuticle-degrading protease n=1 Tax=Lichtheimia corymbifera JMRC:FSU:9682 TaxID=1263082 RepID=A0A068RUL5_9FUNG|nr:cuticle-degrading protease precursor [Lichtheimia corymbifera JMRC:FSU:9682]